MKVRTKAFLQVVGAVAAMTMVAVLLNVLFPKFGFIIYMSGVMLYILWCLYNIRVYTMESEQERIVDELKK